MPLTSCVCLGFCLTFFATSVISTRHAKPFAQIYLPCILNSHSFRLMTHTHTHTYTHTGKGLPPHLSLQSFPECFTSTAGFRQGHFNDLYTRNDSYKVFLLECNNHNPFCMWTLRMQWLTASLRHQAQMLKWGEPLSSLWIITDVKHMRAKQTLVK